MAPIQWRFRKIEDGQKAQNPTHREHLKDVVESLVRETIQNSLDATLRPAESSESPVTRVVFTLGECSKTDIEQFTEGLLPHLSAAKDILPDGLPADKLLVQFLSIEDFGTRGLVGDPELFDENLPNPISGDKKNHFYHFWHAVGQSPGEHKRRGSWGVGKVVFSNASAIRLFFGLTRFHGCDHTLLMGECGIRVHQIPGDSGRYDWYGHFAEHVTTGTGGICPRPVKDSTILQNFQRIFRLSRGPNESGLSLVIPFIRREFTLNELVRFTIENYFYAIAVGRLEVIVRNATTELKLTKTLLADVVTQTDWPMSGRIGNAEIGKLLDLAHWHQQLGNADLVVLKITGGTLKPEQWPGDSLTQCTTRFANGEPVALRVIVPLKQIDGQSIDDSIDLVLQRDDQLRKSNVVHMRAGITLPDLREKAGSGVRGLLLVGLDEGSDQGPLDKLLQKAEGPAHRNWETSGEHYDQAKNTYDNAYGLIRFCRGLAAQVREALITPVESRDIQTLRDYFPDPTSDKPGKPKEEKPPKIVETPPGIIEGVVKSFSLSLRGTQSVAAASVQLQAVGATAVTVVTDADGKFHFEHLSPDEYEVTAQKEAVGETHKIVHLPAENGIYVELILLLPSPPKMFTRDDLDDGFVIRGNPNFNGELRPIRIRTAYATWGGGHWAKYRVSDFDLMDQNQITIASIGIAEDRKAMAPKSNVLFITPTEIPFRVEVRGFDRNRALHVQAYSVQQDNEEDET